MADWRDATDEEASSLSSGGGGWRDATEADMAAAPAKTAVAPGDVEGLKKLFAEQDKAGPYVPLTRDPTVLGELTGGIKQAASDIGTSVSKKDESGAPISDLEQALYAGRAGLGVVRAAAAPLAPVESAASRVGSGIQDYLLSKGANPTLASVLATVGDVGTNLGLTAGLGPTTKLAQAGLRRIAPEAANVVDSLASKTGNLLKSGRTKAAEATAAKEAGLASEEAKLAQTKSNIEARNESFQSVQNAAERSAPTESTVRNIAGEGKAEDVGARFKSNYQEKLAAGKQEANALYDRALKGTGDVEANIGSYEEAFNKVLGEKGVSRPLPTQAEQVAGKAKSILDVSEEAAAQMDEFRKGMARAQAVGDKWQENQWLETMKQYMKENQLPENPTVQDMVKEVQRLKVGQRAAQAVKNDNLVRQFNTLIDGAEASIPKDVRSALDVANANYRENFAPYFGKRSVTRAIAEGSPERVATDIIRPNSDKNALEKITRAYELVKDPEQQAAIAKAHLNSLIDNAAKTDNFGKSLVSGWDRYTNASGNGNKVLRMAYGKDYEDVNSLMNQFRTAKSRDLSSTVDTVVKQGVKEGKIAEREAVAAKAAIEKKAEDEIKSAMGNLHDYSKAGILIGPLFVMEGIIHSAIGSPGGGTRILSGIGLMISRPALQKVMAVKQGRSLVKAALRSVPGSKQAFATARALRTFSENLPQEGQE